MSSMNRCVVCKLRTNTNYNKSVDVGAAEQSQRVLMNFVEKEIVGVERIVDLGRKYLCQKCFRDIESHKKICQTLLNTEDVAICTPTLWVYVVIIIIVANAIIIFHKDKSIHARFPILSLKKKGYCFSLVQYNVHSVWTLLMRIQTRFNAHPVPSVLLQD